MRFPMLGEYVECGDLSGKTIQTLRIHKDGGEGTTIQIELTDGTSFSCTITHSPAVTASHYRGGAGTPEVHSLIASASSHASNTSSRDADSSLRTVTV